MKQILDSPSNKKMSFIVDQTSMPAMVRLYQSLGQSLLDIVFSMARLTKVVSYD